MQKALLFDSHCHLDDDKFDLDRDNLISSLPGKGIAACLTCGSDLASSRAGIALAEEYPFVYAAAGVHPHQAAQAQSGDLEDIRQLLKHDKVVALGEIGLDFYYDFSPKDVQEDWLNRQLDLAYELGMPVVLHVREAHGRMLDIMKARRDHLPGGVLHCFSGSAESAREYERLGFYISFAGSLTFKNAHNLREAAQAVSAERLLIETDSPYLAPVPFRGKRNDPSLVSEVCGLLAELRGLSFEDTAKLTCENACRLFKLNPVCAI